MEKVRLSSFSLNVHVYAVLDTLLLFQGPRDLLLSTNLPILTNCLKSLTFSKNPYESMKS